jgi:pimeloyl-ACP methyl ester carboxylesterase
VPVNGIEIALWEWPGDGPPVFFCHATGFHARIWDQVIQHLPERRCVAFDARGHGCSSKPAPPYAWRNFGADAAALTESLGLSGAVGVGHSMGGHAVVLASALRPDAFSALVLFDPVIRAQDQYTGPWKKTEFVAKRRNQWASAQEMFERFEHRPPFDSWDPCVLRDYCDHALQRDGDGYILACPPAIEASIYDGSTAVESNIYPEMASVQIPVHVVRAGRRPDPSMVMGTSVTAPGLAAGFARGSDTCLVQNSHFIPMEAPELAAKFIAAAPALL